METRLAVARRHGALRGRTSECGSMDGLLADVRRGVSRSLVLRGEAGIGKTALLQYLVESASDMTVARAVGVESEMELAYAGLQQLCAPLLDRMRALPPPQRDALRVAFGVTAGPRPDRFLVGLGVLSLLSEVAEERPLLCVVDDAQWLDQASALTLAFVARRLLAERVGIVFAAREPSAELEHLSGLELSGLTNGDARALLGSAVRFVLDERVRDRIIAETRGNPLALLELPRGLSAAQLAVGFGLVDSLALPGRIEGSFLRRVEGLSGDGRRLLLVAAAEPVGDPVLVWRAAGWLGIEAGVAGRLEGEGLVVIGERVIFRHPLVRSAVYRSASVEERRLVHLALAEVTDREVDPDRRAWHLAAAASGPDESVAAELERSADRARARGGVAAAAAFLKRSLTLTLDAGRRGQRALAAAEAHLQAGAFEDSLRLLASLEPGSLDDLGRARVQLLRGQVAFASTFGGDASTLLLRAATQLEPLDPALARETYLDAWASAWFAGEFAPAGALREVSRAGISAPQPTWTPRPCDLLLDGLSTLVVEGRMAAAPKLSQAARLFSGGEIAGSERLRWGWMVTPAAWMLWDVETHRKLVVQQLQSLREAGLLVHLPIYLQQVAINAAWRGDLAAAALMIAEAEAVAEATGTRLARYAAVFLAGLRGTEADASALIDLEVNNASTAGQGVAIQWCQWVSAVLHNGGGRYERALADAKRASEAQPELFISGWALAELVEAAARAGEPLIAGEALERLAEAASVGDGDWASGVLARSRALLSEGPDADAAYREAIERLGRTALAPELARAHLLYGEWLRRENRRVDAREQLRAAHDQLTAIGMDAFAERARTELQATGEHVRAHTVQTRDDLTAQERQIAGLARDGLSNPEIGARLFLSPRTVEWHLRHVFAKLGIKSRREIATAMPISDTVPA